MNKYYIVTNELAEILHTLNYIKIKKLETDSAIVYTELTLEELKEYIKQIPPKIPY